MCIQNKTRQGKFHDRKSMQKGQVQNTEAPEKTPKLKTATAKMYSRLVCQPYIQPTVRGNMQPTAVLNVGVHSLQDGQGLVTWTLWLTVYFLPLTLQDQWREIRDSPFLLNQLKSAPTEGSYFIYFCL